jgi:hypothetical protein
MYKQIMIPKEWYGMRVEIIATPVVSPRKQVKDNDIPSVETMFAQYLDALRMSWNRRKN